MKRRIALCFLLPMFAGACGEQAASPREASLSEAAWVTPPGLKDVEIEGTSLTLAGTASPSGRVVVSDPDGSQFAVAADGDGTFTLGMPMPTAATLYRLEVQSGQVRYPAPGRLFVAGTSGGPIAFVIAGSATRRFDAVSPLDDVDSDGTTSILSGRANAGTTIRVETDIARDIPVGPDGRWAAVTVGAPARLRVGGQDFAPLLTLAGSDGLSLTPGGWRLVWTAPGGGRQVTWLPDTAAQTSR
ncbi:MAG: hypothetical protein IM674_06185 [Brevundimonas sp.]|nr:hypothetical protein [Brevundimonas sp.]